MKKKPGIFTRWVEKLIIVEWGDFLGMCICIKNEIFFMKYNFYFKVILEGLNNLGLGFILGYTFSKKTTQTF